MVEYVYGCSFYVMLASLVDRQTLLQLQLARSSKPAMDLCISSRELLFNTCNKAGECIKGRQVRPRRREVLQQLVVSSSEVNLAR